MLLLLRYRYYSVVLVDFNHASSVSSLLRYRCYWVALTNVNLASSMLLLLRYCYYFVVLVDFNHASSVLLLLRYCCYWVTLAKINRASSMLLRFRCYWVVLVDFNHASCYVIVIVLLLLLSSRTELRPYVSPCYRYCVIAVILSYWLISTLRLAMLSLLYYCCYWVAVLNCNHMFCFAIVIAVSLLLSCPGEN